MNNNNNNHRRNDEQNGSWSRSAMVTGGIAAAVVGGLASYLFTRNSIPSSTNNPPCRPQETPQTGTSGQSQSRQEESSSSSFLTNILSRMATISGSSSLGRDQFSSPLDIPANPVINNLNALLSDIFVRYIKLKDNDFDLHYRVFDNIFQYLHRKMKEVDPYYNKYSSTVQFAGSHYDNLRIKKPDEFDMDIVIGLPLSINTDPFNTSASDIIIEPKSAGFLQLRMGVQFQRLPMRDREEWLVNKAAYEWKDDSNYLLRSKFMDWFKGVVNRALNKFDQSVDGRPMYNVGGITYIIDKSESGPAMTLFIKNRLRGFQLDVDLVPALRLPENRWPIGKVYRHIPAACKKNYWMVVGKPNKASPIQRDQQRSWRIALQNQERQLMHDLGNLKQAIRLMKKLRDTLGMTKVASYYIKTLFFWEIVERNDSSYWKRNSPATIFKMMVARLHKALVAGNIPYFWNKGNNMIGNVDRNILNGYAAKLEPLMAILEKPDQYKFVAKFLLTPSEFKDYNAKFLHI